MSPSLILILAFTQVPAEIYGGQIVTVQGQAVLVRGETQYRAVGLAGLQPGDELRTADDGGLALRLANGAIVYLGAGTQVTLGGTPRSPQLELAAGELRVIAGAGVELPIRLPEGTVTTAAGATRIQRQADTLRIGVERGSAQIALRGGREIALDQARELRVEGGQIAGPEAFSAQGWTIDLAQMLGAGVDEEMRRRRTVRSPSDLAAEGTDRSADQDTEGMRRPPSATQNQVASASIASSLAGLSASPGQAASAGLFADANQATNQGQDTTTPGFPPGDPFPGNIHLVTGETRYGLSNVNLNATEASAIFGGGDPAYFSIGLGASPNVQVTTDLNTASGATPHAIRIPRFNAYVLKLEQYGTFDSTLDPAGALNNNIGPAGLLGQNPTAPTVNNADPLRDTRNAAFNETATFALGEFRLRPNGGPDNGSFELAVRHSDQDRKIIKDPMGNDANDLVTPNPDVGVFDDVVDARFLPAAPTVKVPRQGTFNTAGTRFSELNNLRRAAATTILADQLHDYARRTRQTRFVIDGKVIDISGYRRP